VLSAKMVKKVGKYEIGKTIGEGTFGKVKLAINTETNEKVAIKVCGATLAAVYSLMNAATLAAL
jgi:ABC-type proline/glycine betaine transport system permease subunit